MHGSRRVSASDVVVDPFFVSDASAALYEWNDRTVEMTGYTDDELSSMRVTDLFSEADRDRVERAHAEALESGRATVEADLVTRGGEHLTHLFRVKQLPASDSRTPTVATIGRDATERRAAERARHGLLDRLTDPFLALDTDSRVTYLNASAERVLEPFARADLEFGAVAGEEVYEAFPGLDGTEFRAECRRALDARETVVYEEFHETSSTWFEVRLYPSPTGVSVLFQDVTARRRQRETLESRAGTLRRMYEVISDRDREFADQVGALLEVGCETLGTEYGSFSRVEGDDYLLEVVHAPDEYLSAGERFSLSDTYCERVVTEAESLVLSDVPRDAPNLTDRLATGEYGVACYAGAPVFCDEELYGTLCFFDKETRPHEFDEWERTVVDLMSQWVSYGLTRRRATERLTEERDRMEQFASIVSHDLRNPLSILESWLDVLADPDTDEATGAKALEHCEEAADRMGALIEDLLVLARAGDLQTEPVPVDLADVARAAWSSVGTERVTLEVATDLTVSADRGRLRQALENLFRNSVEHGSTGHRASPDDSVELCSTSSRPKAGDIAEGTPASDQRPPDADNSVEHGSEGVTVTVGSLSDDATDGDADAVVGGFYVEDDGPGIPAEERETVFERGYSTRPDGTGFGLSIVKEVSEAHDWEVRVTESAAGGARFEFRADG
jgi:PAS domain S-box-containing protein